ncbi:MAG: NifU family protein [Parvibaculaceae bacterium]
MFIQTEATPNPATLKFLPGRDVMGEGQVADFPNGEAAKRSPLATKLFGVESVAGVFFGSDFITVTKADGEWQHLKPALLGTIMEHFTSGADLFYGAPTGETSAHAAHEGEDAEIVREIKEVLDTRIRPAVAQDGGDITFQGFDQGIVYLNMVGSCAGCPSSTVTLKRGVENTLKHYVPEVLEVRAV